MIKQFVNTDAETTSEVLTLPRAYTVLSVHKDMAREGNCKCTALPNGYAFEYNNLPFAKCMHVLILEVDDE